MAAIHLKENDNPLGSRNEVSTLEDERKHILIVDDERVVCDAIARHLRAAGYDVRVAYSGVSALENLNAARFDLALIDIRMPQITGLKVLDELKRGNPDAKAIMMTAYADITSAVHSISQGAFDIISKPVDIDEIVTTIRRCLSE